MNTAYATSGVSAMRSRPNALYSSATTSVNNNSSDSYSATSNERGGGFRRLLCCGKSRSSNNRLVANKGCSGVLCGCYIREESRPKWLSGSYNFTKSITWIIFHFCFSIFLMFGPAIQSLADVGETGDDAFLYLRIIMLVFFTVDMLLRCIAEKDYFVLTLCKGGSDRRNSGSVASRTNTTGGNSKEPNFRIGSFLFWCDFLSTLSILYDLSFVNNHHFRPVTVEVNMIRGYPDPKSFSFFQTGRLKRNSLECNLLIVILRTARCARFVQSRAAVDASNIFKCYGIINKFNSCFCSNLWPAKRDAQERSLSTTRKDAENTVFMSEANIDGRNQKSKKSTVEGEAHEKRRARKQFNKGIWKKIKYSVMASGKELDRRNDAAIKIQRTWRNRVHFESDDEWGVTRNFNKSTVSVWSNVSTRKKSTLASFAERRDSGESRNDPKEAIPESRFQSKAGKANESQVGTDMRQMTGRRVAIVTLLILICTVLCTYTESTTKQISTMMVLHAQTEKPAYVNRSLEAAVSSSTPMLYMYELEGKEYHPNPDPDINGTSPSRRNQLIINVTDTLGRNSIGHFDNSKSVKREAIVEIIATLFIVIFWFAGVVSFSGPVVLLVITPVEQMVRLLSMLTLDPLGYQSTPAFKKFLLDEDAIFKETPWTKEVLKGMETSFLKSTILRIGSLMKVGFGSAGVQIIQNNLETRQNQNMLILNSQGTTVSCIFLFCDIRQFTDATEQLQEEVFVFTNRIAAVVHSICNSYGGAANKNVGDAFLVSWSLDEKGRSSDNAPLRAKNNQADKALLSVIKICISLTYDYFFLEPLSNAAIGRLKTKLKDRTGSVVQMGFGLHAGKAVQGAIGSQRKIDATYVAESAELAEFLESSTKKYKLKLLMSGEFHKLLHSRTRDRCRKIDQLLMRDYGDESNWLDDNDEQQIMNLFTFDMDMDALQRSHLENDDLRNTISAMEVMKGRQSIRNRRKGVGRRMSRNPLDIMGGGTDRNIKNEVNSPLRDEANLDSFPEFNNEYNINNDKPKELVLPRGPALYSQNDWQSSDMKKIRQKYLQDPYFFEKYKSGVEAFYHKEWDLAKKYFQNILERFDDGPSTYFLAQIQKHNGIPPKGFKGYGMA